MHRDKGDGELNLHTLVFPIAHVGMAPLLDSCPRSAKAVFTLKASLICVARASPGQMQLCSVRWPGFLSCLDCTQMEG